MIATWMVTATIFSLLLGVAALAGEKILRTVNRQGRVVWIVALVMSVAWPLVAPLLVSLPSVTGDNSVADPAPAVQLALDAVAGSMASIPTPWLGRLNAFLIAVWVTCSLILLARLLLAMRSLSALEKRAERGAIAGVPVLLTTELGPAVFGVRRMRFLMPRWLLDLDESLRDLVLRHEQEHSRARDPQLTLVGAVALALVPWNLGAWWIVRRVRLAIELDCDARVLRQSTDRERYARLLILIAQRQSRNVMATMLAASTSDLNRRISSMNTIRPRKPALRLAAFTLAGAVAVACSGRVGADLVTSPPSGAVASQQVTTFYSPEGASPAVLLEHPPAVYPAALRSSGVTGEVHAMFVVDSSGRVPAASLRIVRSTDSLFTKVVRGVVVGMKFTAPTLNGRKVRQLVQQTFVFDPRGSAPPRQVAQPTTDPTNRNPMPLNPIVISR